MASATSDSRTTQGRVISTWAAIITQTDPLSVAPDRSSIITDSTYTPRPIATPGTVRGASNSVITTLRPRKRVRESARLAGTPASRLQQTATVAVSRLVRSGPPNSGRMRAYQRSV